MPEKTKIAFVGAGGLASRMHYPSLASFEDVAFVANCDLIEEKARALAQKFNIPNTYSDYKKMIEKEAPQGVYIIMPPHHMYDIVVWCLAHKLHVFVEKPPGLTARQTRELAYHAERNGCLTMTGFQRRFAPIFTWGRKRCEESGPIHQVVSCFYKDSRAEYNAYYQGAIDVLTSDAIHAVDAMRYYAGGHVVKVASSVRRLGGAKYENSFNTLVTFDNGCDGILLANWRTGRRFFKLELHSPGASFYADVDADGRFCANDGKVDERVTSQGIAESTDDYVYAGFKAENRHFIDCIRAKRQPSSHFADAVKTMELVDKIYHSSLGQ
jgi:predicted dehydrogenase